MAQPGARARPSEALHEDRQIDEIEDQLIRRARADDADAYGELARRHQRAALRVATVVLGTAEGADDVVQQALERGWRSMRRFEPGRPFRPWLLQIVANTARNDRRGRGRRARLAVRAANVAGVDTSSAAATPDERAIDDADRGWVVDALNRLDASDRLVLALRHFEHLPDREIAEVLGVPLGTAKSRLSRAMARLRAELTKDLALARDRESETLAGSVTWPASSGSGSPRSDHESEEVARD